MLTYKLYNTAYKFRDDIEREVVEHLKLTKTNPSHLDMRQRTVT